MGIYEITQIRLLCGDPMVFSPVAYVQDIPKCKERFAGIKMSFSPPQL